MRCCDFCAIASSTASRVRSARRSIRSYRRRRWRFALARLSSSALRRERLQPLLEQVVLGARVLRLVQQRTRSAQRSLRLGQARGVQLGTGAVPERCLAFQARFQLLLVLQHHPLGVLLARFLRVLFLVGAKQHHHRGQRQHDGEHHQTDAERRERQAGDLAAVNEQGQARAHEHERQRDGQPHLHAALAASAFALGAFVVGFQQRLVSGLRRCEVVLRQIDGVLAFRLVDRQRVDLVAQGALFRRWQLNQLRHAAVGGAMGCDQHVLLVAQRRYLVGQRVYLVIQLLDVRALDGQRLDRRVQSIEARQKLVALGFQLAELLILPLEALGLLGGGRHLGAQLVLLRREVGDGVLDAGGARSVLSQLFLHGGQRVSGRSARSRTGGEQLSRNVGGVAQRPQLVAGQGEHRLKCLFVDVGHEGCVALQAVAVAHARELELGRARGFRRGKRRS